MNILIVEDDFISRKLLQSFLSPYGACDIAINGREAVEAFEFALKDNNPYDLICLDIMMPEMDGQEALKQIRDIEEKHKIQGLDSVKIVMTTALGDAENIKMSFRQQAEAYLVKPIHKDKLLAVLRDIEVIK